MRALPTICVLAGGRGTRLGTAATSVPKPLVEVAGEPFLAHQLRLLAMNGAEDVVLCVGHLGHLIEAAIGTNFEGIDIRYSYDDPGLNGTLGAIRKARDLLGERFLVLYGDTYLRIDYRDVAAKWLASGLPAVMTVLRNSDRWDRSNTVVEQGLVLRHNKVDRDPDMAWIDYGLGGISSTALSLVGPDTTDLSDLYGVLAERGLLLAVEASERFFEIGTPEALAETDAFLRTRLGTP